MGGPWSTQVLGARIDLVGEADALSDAELLFGEDGARVIVSCTPADAVALLRLAEELGVPCRRLGQVAAPDGTITIARADRSWHWMARNLRQIYTTAIPRRMSDDALTPREG
jgi:hypothetical protein